MTQTFRVLALSVLLFLGPAARAQDSGQSTPGHMMHMLMGMPNMDGLPHEAGQSAFAAIQEIVTLLESDPKTDWTKVNIEALRQHLIDMDNVTLRAAVKSEPVDSGLRFTVTGQGDVVGSIQRMVAAHAATMNGDGGWAFAAQLIPDGAALTVKVPDSDVPKLQALGFIGVMARGMHHQKHHLMIATGAHPH